LNATREGLEQRKSKYGIMHTQKLLLCHSDTGDFVF